MVDVVLMWGPVLVGLFMGSSDMCGYWAEIFFFNSAVFQGYLLHVEGARVVKVWSSEGRFGGGCQLSGKEGRRGRELGRGKKFMSGSGELKTSVGSSQLEGNRALAKLNWKF